MRRLVLILDSLLVLRSAANASDVDAQAAAKLAELAAVDAVRLGINDELLPVSEQDVADVRRVVRAFELGMPASLALVKVALEAQPDRVVLGLVGRDGGLPSQPVDLRSRATSLAPMVRSLADAGIPVSALVRPTLDAVKAAHNEGVDGVEFFAGSIVDLPAADRARELETVGDAVRLASKLGMHISAGGGLGYHSLAEVVDHAPAVASVAVGRAIVARAILVGLDRAVRDLRALLR